MCSQHANIIDQIPPLIAIVIFKLLIKNQLFQTYACNEVELFRHCFESLFKSVLFGDFKHALAIFKFKVFDSFMYLIKEILTV